MCNILCKLCKISIYCADIDILCKISIYCAELQFIGKYLGVDTVHMCVTVGFCV